MGDVDAHICAGVKGNESIKAGHQLFRGQGGRGRDPDLLAVFQSLDPEQGAAQHFQALVSSRLEDFALPGEAHGTAGSGEEGNSHQTLQLLDLMADCGRRHPQCISRAGEAQMLCGGIKSPQGAQTGEQLNHGEILAIFK